MSMLSKPYLHDEESAYQMLESLLWPRGPVCSKCGAVDKQYRLSGKATRIGLVKCGHCLAQHRVTVGTVFESSHVPLHKWLQAAYLLASSKKGISSHQLARTLEVTVKTGWFMSHRLREAMTPKGSGKLGGGGIVEADETFVGRKPGTKVRRGHGHKNAVFSLVEREGNVRSFHVADVTADTLKDKLNQNVAKSARLMTDDAGQYEKVGKRFLDHQSVNHSAGEYVRGDTHTNTVEGFFSIFKRGVYGIYQHMSSKHLHRYTAEFDFRYNGRKITDGARTEAILTSIKGKRLLYRDSSRAGV